MELCRTCYSRVDAAHKLWLSGKGPTATQAETLAHMGRPTPKMLLRWPELRDVIAEARTMGIPAPEVPKPPHPQALPVAEVVELKPAEPVAQLTPPVDLAALVSQLQARAELGRLALDLRQDDYRKQLVSKLAEAACHGLEDDAAEIALPLAVQELSAALESLSSRLEWAVMQQATGAEGVQHG